MSTSNIAKLLEAFSVKNVKERYARAHLKPCRNHYGIYDGATCLIGSFEHVNFGSLKSTGDATAEMLKVPLPLLRAMEAGWEGWKLGRDNKVGDKDWFEKTSFENDDAEPLPLPKKGTPLRRAYEHGQRLARVLKPAGV